jgi:hypothetical protein
MLNNHLDRTILTAFLHEYPHVFIFAWAFTSLLYTEVHNYAVHKLSHLCCTQKFTTLLYTNVHISALHKSSQLCCTQTFTSLLYTDVHISPVHERFCISALHASAVLITLDFSNFVRTRVKTQNICHTKSVEQNSLPTKTAVFIFPILFCMKTVTFLFSVPVAVSRYVQCHKDTNKEK